MRARAALVCGTLLAAGCLSRWDGVLTSLSDPDPRQRVEAVRRIDRGGSPEDLSSLIYRVNDPDPEVRGAIAQAIGSLDNRQASDALATLVTDDVESVQVQAAAALARQHNPRAHHYLLLAYQRDGPLVRARVAELLKTGGSSPAEAVTAEATALYAKYSEDLAGTGAERLIAAERLGSSGRPEAVERLTSYLGAESRSLAMAAARGLGASGSIEARGPLEALLTEDDPALRMAGAEALGELGDPQSAAALSRAIQQDVVVAPMALRSLIRLAQLERDQARKPPAQTARLLCELVQGSDASLTRLAAAAIKELGASCNPERLEAKLYRGGDVEGVLAGITVLWAPELDGGTTDPSLEGTGRARVSNALGAVLRNGAAQARPLAARAIGALGFASLQGDLERARKEADLEIHRSREHWIKVPDDAPSLFNAEAASTLALLGETTVAEIRLSSLEASSEEAREAATALMAHDPAPTLRQAAVEAVPWISADKQWEILKPMLIDPDSGVRQAAVLALKSLTPPATAAGAWTLDELQQSTGEADVVAVAVPLIEALGTFRDLPGLDAALSNALEKPESAPAAANVLGARGDRAARAAILSHLKQPFALALPELLHAVTERADLPWDDSRLAAEACRGLLFHPRPEVRAAAVRALEAIEGPSAAAEVQALALDYDVHVRLAVARHP